MSDINKYRNKLHKIVKDGNRMVDALDSIIIIKSVCENHTNGNDNCVGCIYHRNVSIGGLGCVVQTAPCDYDIDYIKDKINLT